MALPQHLRDSFSPDEIEFIASDEPITIIPSHRLLNIHRYLLASTPTGPLRPPLRAEVPLWLALTLRKRRKCQIVPPDWLNADHLRSVLDEELKDEERFATLPFHYMETAALLLEVAAEDIPRSDLVRTLLKDLREARQVKTRDGFQAIRVNYLQMDNLSLMEVNEIRPFFTHAFNSLRRIEGDSEPDEQEPNQETQDDSQDSSMRDY